MLLRITKGGRITNEAKNLQGRFTLPGTELLVGGDYPEKYFQRTLALELSARGISYKEQVRVPLQYKTQSMGHYCIDFLIDDKIVLEIKKDRNFSPRNIEQVHSYLKAMNLQLGILANFTAYGLNFKRIVNTAQHS